MNTPHEKNRILVVDDEPQVLKSIQGLLEDDFVVLANTDGESALRLLEQEEVAVILSDQRMPGLTGDQFLKEAQKRSQALRVLITGYADLDALMRAVNDGKIYAYVAKPWDPTELRVTIQNAVDHYRLTRENQRLTSELLQTNARLQVVNRQQAAVVELGQCALEGMDLSTLMDRAVALVAQTLDVEHGKILELLPDGDALLLRAGVGWKEGLVGNATVGVGTDSQAGYTLLTHEPVIVEDLRTETRFRGPALLLDHGVVSGVSVIIRGQARPFGVLGAHTVQRRTFSKDDAHFLQSVANLLTEAIERRHLEQQLFQAQKMEAMGTLAGGIAHDFNNELTGIIGFAQLALLEDLPPQGRDYIARIPEQGKRAANLISQLLTFSRQAVTEKQPMSLLSMSKEAIKVLERTLPANIAIRLSASRQVSLVNADPTQMQQVIMNLCINASHAMPHGGELTVNLANATLDEAYCRQYAYARPGDHVCLAVRDTGVGMAPEVQARIFEPFFTTKQVGQGTGLGLAMVYGIVKEHGGHVNVYSEVGKGSEFKVYLPAMNVGATPVAAPEQEPPAGGTETLLLVEDQDTAMMAGQRILEKLGYTVLTATNGEEALAVYRAHQDRVALVLTDMVMPKMGGQELYEALKQIDPGVKVLLMSGYSLKGDVSDLRARGLKEFVQKPFDIHALSRAVRRAIDE